MRVGYEVGSEPSFLKSTPGVAKSNLVFAEKEDSKRTCSPPSVRGPSPLSAATRLRDRDRGQPSRLATSNIASHPDASKRNWGTCVDLLHPVSRLLIRHRPRPDQLLWIEPPGR